MADDDFEARLRATLDADAPHAPPPDRIAELRRRVETSRARPVPAIASVPARPARRPRWLAAAAAIIALVAGAAIALFVSRGDDGSVAGDVEFDGPMAGPRQEAAAELRITATGIGRIIELDTDVLPILPTSEYYEVWFVAPDDAPGALDRISAGTFHPDADGRSQVRFTAAVDPSRYPVVEITAEPGDGDPGPTGPVVLTAVIE